MGVILSGFSSECRLAILLTVLIQALVSDHNYSDKYSIHKKLSLYSAAIPTNPYVC